MYLFRGGEEGGAEMVNKSGDKGVRIGARVDSRERGASRSVGSYRSHKNQQRIS